MYASISYAIDDHQVAAPAAIEHISSNEIVAVGL